VNGPSYADPLFTVRYESTSLRSSEINFRPLSANVIILSVVLYGCETRSPTMREERRLKVSENRELRRIFGPKRGTR
jgi:hypothetical protein